MPGGLRKEAPSSRAGKEGFLKEEGPKSLRTTLSDSRFTWEKAFTGRLELNQYFINHLYRLSPLKLDHWCHSGLSLRFIGQINFL